MSYTLKHGSKIGAATVISNDIRTKGAAVPGRKLQSIGYITMHNTGCTDVKANNFHRSLKNQNNAPNGRKASWHYSVDDIEIYQEVEDNMEAWHAGNSTGNKNSIGIEMCQWSDKEKQRKTYDNAARLVAELMKKHKISINKVVQHNHWSGKNCPQYLRENKHGYNWSYFIDLVKKYYDGKGPTAPVAANKVSYVVKITTDSLNVRKGPSTSYEVVTTVKKGGAYTIIEENNGWGKLKSGAGYISLNSKYIERI